MSKLYPYSDFPLIHRITPYTSVEKYTRYFNVDCLSWPDNCIYWQYSEYSKDIDNSIEFNLWTRLCSTEQFRAIPPKLLLAKTVHSGLLDRKSRKPKQSWNDMNYCRWCWSVKSFKWTIVAIVQILSLLRRFRLIVQPKTKICN